MFLRMKLFRGFIFLYFATETRGESYCASSSDALPVATMCRASTAFGNFVVVDVTGAADRMVEGINSCTCYITPVVYKENARLYVIKQISVEPGYNGCGSRVDVVMTSTEDSGILRNICFINGNIEVKNNSMGNISFVKEFPPNDDRYCVGLRLEMETIKTVVKEDNLSCETSALEYAALKIAFITTVLAMAILSIGGVSLGYKLGFKKGKKRHQAETFKENAQSGHYYNRLHGTIARQEIGVDFVQLREQVNSSSLRDAEYEEIKNLDRHQMFATETDKDDVFTSPMSQNLCAVRVDGNGYLSPTATVKQ
uniref:Uncharacterized protein LOC111103049 isoform X2 n=1 Tax=Crassostrea virginica TaxID=6565 RepID=A0A8B8AJP4_CRAVI|nr:uncharacterized protein LOC111103049 isoform X2 [Crassostrea virginica]